MTNEPAQSNNPEGPLTLQQQLEPLLNDLLYPSESDETVQFVSCYITDDTLTVSQVKDWLMLPPSIYVEERTEAEFWEPVTQDQEWYGDDERKRTQLFTQVQQMLESQLTHRQMFRVGDTEIDVYLLGLTSDGFRAGLKTKVVET